MSTQSYKTCGVCGKYKLHKIGVFTRRKDCENGLTGTCLECARLRGAEWRKNNRDKIRQKALAYRNRQYELYKIGQEQNPLEYQARHLRDGIQCRSKELGLSRSPELSSKRFFIDWLVRQPCCTCCGTAFSIGRKSGVVRQDAPSIDRFDTSKGYVLDNIDLICWRCNNIKRNYNYNDLDVVSNWMKQWKPIYEYPAITAAEQRRYLTSLIDRALSLREEA